MPGNKKPHPWLRFLAPRLIIYGIVVIATVMVMKHYEGLKGHPKHDIAPLPTHIIHQSSDAALTKALQGNPKPIIVVLAGDEDLSDTVAQAQKALGDSIHVTYVTANGDEQLKAIFKVTQLPAALLFDISNQEKARIQKDSLTTNDILELAKRK